MKIIQMQIGQTSPEDFQVFGLGDDGMLYEWAFERKAYAQVIDNQKTYGRSSSCFEHDRKLVEEALKNPGRYKVTWISGRTAGWLPCPAEDQFSQLTHLSFAPKE